ncbi:lipocalin-like domain-containing protein [Dyella sp.]|uniref:lipocalin-like domain-containing protein n=1 Tax=Dyella sp. TaxID=1869338 RepID=UPI002ED072E1
MRWLPWMQILAWAWAGSCVAGSSAFEQAVQRADAASGAADNAPSSLVGAWSLVRVDNVYPDGHRVELYGPHPQGLWIIDAQGRYMMQMVRGQRTAFASGDKARGTADEYRATALCSNAHYGQVRVQGHVLQTHIEHASFPNWDDKSGSSVFSIKGDTLIYTVAKPSSGAAEGAHGEVEWRRLP